MSQSAERGRRLRRALLLSLVGVWALTSTVNAQTTAVIAGGPHDLTNGSALRNTNTSIAGQTCVFCHVPHSGATSIPLWNRRASTATYQTYTSSTSDVTATSGQISASVSGACLSCHDGSIAVDVLLNLNGLPFNGGVAFTRQSTAKSSYTGTGGGTMSGGLPFLGTDLRNDHPVAITYETARAAKPLEFTTQLVTGAKITVGSGANPVPLFGASAATATVECSSCHNAHNNSLGNFLRKSNSGSAICLSCHIK